MFILLLLLPLSPRVLRAQENASNELATGRLGRAFPPGEIGSTNRAVNRNTERPPRVSAPYLLYDIGTVTVRPSTQYEAGPIWRFLFGEDYRRVWSTPVEVPVLDLDRTAGGLTPIEKGGGLQTVSLHVMGDDGHQYVLRSVNKDAARSLPESFQRTVVSDIARDQTAAVHPFAAFILPKLAEAAGILHTYPTLVMIPDHPRLGEFRDEFAGMLALFERKPDENQAEVQRFGYSRNIVGTEKLLENLREDNDERVDERAYARARIFDMWIGDWDRHDDQWRWAEFETKDGQLSYVAVPRDRDFALVKFDGFLHHLAKRSGNVTARRLVNFGDEIKDVLGLNYQGAKLDRRFTASLTRQDWIDIAESVRNSMTDEVIEEAVRGWPDPVYEQTGQEIINALKARRSQLPDVASEYYGLLAHTVDVVGSDKQERFEVVRKSHDQTEITVHQIADNGESDRELFRRTFFAEETEEVRLYGLGGDDEFRVTSTGEVRVRMVGGDGTDRFVDSSDDARGNYFYDTRKDNEWDVESDSRVFRSNDPAINRYEMKRFEFDSKRFFSAPSYNSEEGIFLGLGVQFLKPGFRKDPYAARHIIRGAYAPQSQAYRLRYEGDFIRIWRGWGLTVDADAMAARSYRYFYDLGNETLESNRLRYEARMGQVDASSLLRRYVGSAVSLGIGPRFEFTSFEPPKGRGEDDPRSLFRPEQFTDTYFVGLESEIAIDTRDSLLSPSTGIYWYTNASTNTGIRHASNTFARFTSAMSLYQSLGPLTAALRVGGATNVGDFLFYQANTLGNDWNLRGFGRTRFSGRSSFFTNAELRAELMPFNIYLLRGHLGALAFYDIGRVWMDNENSDTWHQGYGGGLWISPFDAFILTGTLGLSEEDFIYNISTGFFF